MCGLRVYIQRGHFLWQLHENSAQFVISLSENYRKCLYSQNVCRIINNKMQNNRLKIVQYYLQIVFLVVQFNVDTKFLEVRRRHHE